MHSTILAPGLPGLWACGSRSAPGFGPHGSWLSPPPPLSGSAVGPGGLPRGAPLPLHGRLLPPHPVPRGRPQQGAAPVLVLPAQRARARPGGASLSAPPRPGSLILQGETTRGPPPRGWGHGRCHDAHPLLPATRPPARSPHICLPHPLWDSQGPLHSAASPLPTLPVGAPLRAGAKADADPDPRVWPIHPAQAWGPCTCSRDLGFTTQPVGREGKREGETLSGRVWGASPSPLGPWNPPRAGFSPGDLEAAELGETAPWVTPGVSRCPRGVDTPASAFLGPGLVPGRARGRGLCVSVYR